jgi:peptidyl-prolyl cis-trans isomerase C
MLQLLRQYLPVRTVAAAAVALLLAGPALAQDDAVVATLNGEPITEADLALAEAELDQQFAQLPEEQRRAAAMTAIVEIRLMSQRAEADGLADTADSSGAWNCCASGRFMQPISRAHCRRGHRRGASRPL